MAISIDGDEDVFCIDSKPVKVCQNARTKRCAMDGAISKTLRIGDTVYRKDCITTTIIFTQSVE